MENASKALLIAGAILIVIVLIGIGVMIISQISGVTDQSGKQMDTVAAKQFNAQFTPYQGNKVRASEIKELISTIYASNAANDGSHKVEFKTGTGQISSATDLSANKTYTVDLKYDKGYVIEISIKANS